MANTYSQIYIHTVFAVDGRLSLIRPEFKEELYKYITGIVRNNKQKLIAINGMSDHVHILIWTETRDGASGFGPRHQGWFVRLHQ